MASQVYQRAVRRGCAPLHSAREVARRECGGRAPPGCWLTLAPTRGAWDGHTPWPQPPPPNCLQTLSSTRAVTGQARREPIPTGWVPR